MHWWQGCRPRVSASCRGTISSGLPAKKSLSWSWPQRLPVLASFNKWYTPSCPASAADAKTTLVGSITSASSLCWIVLGAIVSIGSSIHNGGGAEYAVSLRQESDNRNRAAEPRQRVWSGTRSGSSAYSILSRVQLPLVSSAVRFATRSSASMAFSKLAVSSILTQKYGIHDSPIETNWGRPMR